MPDDTLTALGDALAGLAGLDEKTGKPPEESRLTSVSSLRSQYLQFKRDDRQRNGDRSKVQAAADGAPPYSQGALTMAGQRTRTNANFLDLDRYLGLAVAGFIDLSNSVETLVSTEVTGLREQGEKYFHENNLNVEITHAFRSWDGFYPNYLRLATTFVLHGTGFAVFPNLTDFRFKTCGFGDFFIPSNTPSIPSAIELGVWHYDCPVTELYGYIRNEAAAAAQGWDVELVKDAIKRANTSDKSKSDGDDWESVQRRIKNGDFTSATGPTTVRLIFSWPREFDGSYSFFVATADGPAKNEKGNDGFLYSKPKAYGSVEQAFIPFVFGVGSNGTYHSVRGLGQRLFALVQTINRLRCQLVDGAMLASSLIVQPGSPDQMARLQIQHLGGITAISPGINFVDKSFSPNLTNSVMPALGEISNAMAEKQDFYSSAGAAAGSPYRSRLQVEAELESATRLTSASLSLFYAAWNPLLREMVRRLVNGSRSSDPVVKEFYRRLEERGTPAEIVKLIDHAKTKAVRAIGAGNSAARTAAFNDLSDLAPLLPEDGRKNLVYDRVVNRVGYDAASRYASPADVSRPTIDQKLAELENNDLLEGTPISVQSNELHGEHLLKHLPVIDQIVAGIDDGSVDPMQVLNGLTLLHEHAFTHVQILASDPWSQPAVASAKASLQRAGEQILNFTRRAQAEAEQGATQGEPGAEDQAAQLKAQADQFQAQARIRLAELAVAKTELEMARDEQRHNQKLELADLTTAKGIMRDTGLTSPGGL